MNSWDDQTVRDALAANDRQKVIVSGLWTEVCNTIRPERHITGVPPSSAQLPVDTKDAHSGDRNA